MKKPPHRLGTGAFSLVGLLSTVSPDCVPECLLSRREGGDRPVSVAGVDDLPCSVVVWAYVVSFSHVCECTLEKRGCQVLSEKISEKFLRFRVDIR